MKIVNVDAVKTNSGMTVIAMVMVAVMLFLAGCSGSEPSESSNPPTSPETQISPDPTTTSEPSISPEPATTSEPSISPEPTMPPEPPASPTPPSPSATGEVMVKVFAVKEALSVFIDTGETEVLIDGGNSGSGKEISKAINTYVNGSIEYVIATHSHADHVGGLDRIYEDYAVSHTIYGDTGDSKQFKEFFDAARGEPNSEMKEDVDEVIPLGAGISLSILDILDGSKNTNNNSVISVLNCNGKKMLVTGDAEDHESQDVRDRLISKLASAGLRPIDVYIVGHHGSETSSSDALLDVITPTYGIISSYGPTHKSYKNPDRDVMERLIRHNVKVYGTYRSGDVTIMFKGNEIARSAPDSELLTVENYGAAA